jgi:hypothetical protein
LTRTRREILLCIVMILWVGNLRLSSRFLRTGGQK